MGAGHKGSLVEEWLSIFPSQIRRLSNKKMDEIHNEIQQAQTSAGNCCLRFCFSGKKEARGEGRTGLLEYHGSGILKDWFYTQPWEWVAVLGLVAERVGRS